MVKHKRSRQDFLLEKENSTMERLTKISVKLRRFHQRLGRGQTMSEYALILAAVALVVFVWYQTMGQSIQSMVEWGTIHNDLLSF